MAVTVTVDLNHAEIAAFLYSPGGPMARAVRRWGERVERAAVSLVPKDTGRLASSIEVSTGVTFTGSTQGPYADIGSKLDYAIWRHEGVGIYGSGRPIRPVRARRLRFKPGRRGGSPQDQARRARSGYVYARQVKGYPGVPYLVTALWTVMGPIARIRSFQGRQRRGR